ncbi:mechanosensitive ion channel [Akkermansiaceae bacterium]|nr:mechanosensitive ion channel [Akkermansiaceae bacterium]
MLEILNSVDWSAISPVITQWAIKIGIAFLTVFGGWRVANWAGRLLGSALDQKNIDPTLRPFLTSLVSMVIKVAVVVTAIQTAGVQATSFAAILGAAGLAVGMALSGTLQNFAGGVILLIIRPFRVGDTIETQGYLGKVREIQIFQTILVTGDNKVIHIPNGKLSNESLINYSTMPTRRVNASFGISYDDRIDQARDVILKVISELPQIHATPEPFVKVGALGASSVDLTVRVWVDRADYSDVQFGLNEQVKIAFDEAGISMPFPQRNIIIQQENN